MKTVSVIFVLVFLSAGTKSSNIRERLLTPQEGCGFTKVIHNKIIGGTTAKPGAWPWMALIGSESKMDYNPKYGTNDIAIIYLQRDVEFTDRIHPICLPINGLVPYEDYVDTNPFIAGWGLMREDGKRSDILKQVQMPVLDIEVCKSKYRKVGLWASRARFGGGNVLCAGNLNGGNDTCQGDSGGPLMLPIHVNGTFPFYQIGIVAYGFGCGRFDVPGAYTRIQYFSDWINEKIKQSSILGKYA